MIQSMTGYGKASGEFESKKITVEVKSVNSKYLDVNFRLPTTYREKEFDIKKMLNTAVERGKVDFSIFIEDSNPKTYTINANVIESYFNELLEIASRNGIQDKSSLFELATKMPEALSTSRAELSEEEWDFATRIIQEALINFNSFRNSEGQSLFEDMDLRRTTILDLLQQVEQYEQERVDRVREKIAQKLEELSQEVDRNRLEQELIYYIEKLDVSEEKVRLKTHCDYFVEIMQKPTSEGKKLGFISQEIGREINTLGSKANHAEIQKIVVEMKDNLEKIKEQMLNVL